MEKNSTTRPKIVANKTLESARLRRRELKELKEAKNQFERKFIYLMGRGLAFIEIDVGRELRNIKEEETQMDQNNDWLHEKQLFESLLEMMKDFNQNKHLVATNYKLAEKYYSNIVSLHNEVSQKVKAKKEMLVNQ